MKSGLYTQAYHTKNLNQYSFLITGGAGFIGSNLVEYLISHGAKKVTVLDNLATGKIDNLKAYHSLPNFQFIEGDIRDFNICQEAMMGIDYVSHQAALGSVPRSIKDPITTNQVNIDGFLNVLQAARLAGVKRMVYASSSSVYGDSKTLPKVEEQVGKPLSPYAVSKCTDELYANTFSLAYQFNTVGLRYFNVFGPRQDPNGPYAAVIPLFFKAALTGDKPKIFGDGEQTRDFTFVANVVEANIKALLTDGLEQHEVCNIAFGDRISLNQLWNAICEITETNIKPDYREPRDGDIRDSLADISKAKSMFDYHPKYDLKKGLAEAFEYYRSAK
ncbi:MAG: hypothetical protein RLZ47_413 [Bacteroidota bacterium]|jgi:UDP-N-acetylglucosamine 4-epimerase